MDKKLESIITRLRAGVDPDTRQPHITEAEAKTALKQLISEAEIKARIDALGKLTKIPWAYKGANASDITQWYVDVGKIEDHINVLRKQLR